MQKTDAELIAEVEGLDAKASPGPWTDSNGSQSPDDGSDYIFRKDPEFGSDRVLGADYGYELDITGEDWLFIVKARTLLPELARRLKAANERIEKLEEYKGITLNLESGGTIKFS